MLTRKQKENRRRYELKYPDRVRLSKLQWQQRNSNYGKEYVLKNRDKVAKYKKEYYSNRREEIRLSVIARKMKLFNSNINIYTKLYKEQNGCCKICNTSEANKRLIDALFIDHDHTTGNFRGLICHRCNAMLGYAKDNVGILEKAVEYLKQSRL